MGQDKRVAPHPGTPATAPVETKYRATLEAAGFDGLFQLGRVRRYRKGELIFLEGDMLTYYYIVLSGVVRVFKQAPDGKSVTLATWPALGTFGDMTLFDERGAGASVDTLTDSDVLLIEREAFRAYARARPEIYPTIMRIIVERLKFIQDRLLDIVTLPVERRLVRVLISLTAQFGNEIPLTHQDIADFAGTCRELVSKRLHQLQSTGALQAKRGRILILDAAKLRKLETSREARRPC
jgi:CRP/FNR family transcriptional regulator